MNAPSKAENSVLAETPEEVKVLTVAGNPRFALPTDQQDMMCFTSDGTLFISEAHKTHHYVLGFRERLNRNSVAYKTKLVGHTDIQNLYKRLGVSSGVGDEKSLRQNELIRIMRDAVSKEASDIHFLPEGSATLIKMRVDGSLEPYSEIGLEHGQALVATMYQSMCDVAQPMYIPSKPQDARMSSTYTETLGLKGARIATRPTDTGQLVVARLLYQRDVQPTLASLGFLPEQVALLNRIASRTDGINIISGPTGHGKSTTMVAILGKLLADLKFKANLITIEDPPENTIPGAVHTPVQYPKEATEDEKSAAWARAISNLMRLDPDLAMIGEMRDYASAIAAFRAAMTGHGIYTTLHANDVVSILVRLKDMGVDMSLVTDPLIVTGLISQRLVPRVCMKCRRAFRGFRHLVSDDVRERVEKLCVVDSVWLAGEGCLDCGGRGTKGRIVIPEVVLPTKGFMQAFVKSGQSEARLYWMQKLNGITRNEVLIRRINEGIVDPAQGEKKVCFLDEDALVME